MNLKKFNLEENQKVKEGSKYCDFYSLGGGEGIRVFNKLEKENLKFINHAFKMNKIAYERGVPVPEPYGVVSASINGDDYYGIHLEDLGRNNLEEISNNSEIWEEARDSWIKAVIKANLLGFSCNDSNKKRNAVWVPEKRKTYLIDCDFWKYQGVGWRDF